MPILAKFGIPLAVVAIIAAMRWFNVKASGEPYFPGVDDQRQGKSGGGNALPDLFGKDSGLSEVPTTDSGYVSSDIATEPVYSDPNIGPYGPYIYNQQNVGNEPTPGPARAASASLPGGGGGFIAIPAGLKPSPGSFSGALTITQPSSPTPQTTTPGTAYGGRVFAI